MPNNANILLLTTIFKNLNKLKKQQIINKPMITVKFITLTPNKLKIGFNNNGNKPYKLTTCCKITLLKNNCV